MALPFNTYRAAIITSLLGAGLFIAACSSDDSAAGNQAPGNATGGKAGGTGGKASGTGGKNAGGGDNTGGTTDDGGGSGGAGGDVTGTGGEGGAPVAVDGGSGGAECTTSGSFKGTPTKTEDFLNHTTCSDCIKFSNAALPDPLPKLP